MWIYLVQNEDQLSPPMNTVMKFQIPSGAGNFLNSGTIASISGTNFLYLLRIQQIDEKATILLVISTSFRNSLQQTVCLPRISTGLV